MSRILTTLRYTPAADWGGGVDILDPTGRSLPAHVTTLLARAREYPALVLDGSSRYDQVAASVLGTWPRRPRVVMSDATWKRGNGRLDRQVSWAGMRAMDGRHMTYAVLTTFEQRQFARTWSVDPERVVFTPFCWTLPAAELERPIEGEPRVFAGGESFRDYEPMVAAAAGLDAPVVIASRRLDGRTGLPANVRGGRLTHEEFVDEMRGAQIVVVPMPANADRGAGQTTYLNAMALGKVVVVTDSVGVRDYLEDGRTGLIVPPGDATALQGAISWALDPANAGAVAAMRERARDLARAEFSPQRYVQSLRAAVER
jgi:hypothetical protein